MKAPSWFVGMAWACLLAVSGCAPLALPRPAPGVSGATPAPPRVVATQAPQPRQLLRYALVPIPGSLDPHLDCSPRSNTLLNVVFETLVYLNEDYRLEPSLSESWDASEDATTYTFRLHRSVSFHDGAPFDAAAVRMNFDRIAAAGSAASPLLIGYLGTDELDRYTVRVRFAAPYPDFLRVLAGACLSMVSPAGFSRLGRTAAPAAALPAGTGPFQFASGATVSDQPLVLLRNEGYHWGPASYRHRGPVYVGSGYDTSGPCRYSDRSRDHTGPALLERIELRFEEDPARRAQALESGEVDAAEDLPAGDADRLERSYRFWVFTVPIPAPGGMRGEANALAVRRIDITRLSASDILAAAPSTPVHLNGARKEINCLSYGVQGWDPGFYETSVRAIP